MPESGDKTFYLETFGCQMNVHDSEKVIGTLNSKGIVRFRRLKTLLGLVRGWSMCYTARAQASFDRRNLTIPLLLERADHLFRNRAHSSGSRRFRG